MGRACENKSRIFARLLNVAAKDSKRSPVIWVHAPSPTLFSCTSNRTSKTLARRVERVEGIHEPKSAFIIDGPCACEHGLGRTSQECSRQPLRLFFAGETKA